MALQKTLITFLSFWLLLFSANTLHADTCECPPMEDTETAFNNSDLVLIGRVSDLQSSTFKPGYMEIAFTVLKMVKSQPGTPAREVVIYVPNNECKFDFQYGVDYIVYATGDPFFYRTDVCARNMLFDSSFEELGRLHKLEQQ